MRTFNRKAQSGTGRVAEALENAILKGKIRPGERLESVRRLADSFGVGMTAVMRALDKLERKGLLLRRPRRGIYVAEKEGSCVRRILLFCGTGELSKVTAPSTYFTPHFENCCRKRRWVLDKVDFSFLRSTPPEQMADSLRAKRYDGCISMGSSYTGTENSLKVLKLLKLPTVFACAAPGDAEVTGFPSIVYSRYETWKTAVQFLAEKGFRSIGAVGLKRKGSDRATLRCSQGEHFELLRQYGITIPDRPLCYFDHDAPEEAAATLRDFLEDHRRFDAVLCYSDLHAAFVYEFCRAQKIRIPEDLAVMGIGCYTGWELLSPQLTTIDFHYDLAAEQAAEWLMTPPPPRTCEPLKLEVLQGESTGHHGPAPKDRCPSK